MNTVLITLAFTQQRSAVALNGQAAVVSDGIISLEESRHVPIQTNVATETNDF